MEAGVDRRESVADRNGVKVAVDAALDDVASGMLIVVADAAASRRTERALLPRLRRLARAGVMIGGIDTAPLPARPCGAPRRTSGNGALGGAGDVSRTISAGQCGRASVYGRSQPLHLCRWNGGP